MVQCAPCGTASEAFAAQRDALIGISGRSGEAPPELLLEERFCLGQGSHCVWASAEARCFSGPDYTPGLQTSENE